MSAKSIQSFVPAFEFGELNQSVMLAKDTVVIEVDGNTYTGNGEVRLDLLPRAHVHVYGNFQGISSAIVLNCMVDQKKISLLLFGGTAIPGFRLDIGGDVNQQTMTLKWSPKSEPIIGVGDDSMPIKRVVFHLFNFKDILGVRRSSEQSESTTHAIEHVDLVSDSWKVELRSLVKTSDRFKKLKAEGGYALTHIGCLRKTDGSDFSGKEAAEKLHALRFFLSFAKGIWCEPVCAVDFDESDNRVWESWSSPRESWHSPMSWFDSHHCAQLINLFSGFMMRWNDENWREALHEVIYWYLNANYSPRGIDAGIILTQAAIERLSYEYAVKDKKLIEAKGFKDLRASDKFRLLFSSLDIPIDISTAVPELEKLAKQFNWLDAPHTLTEVRNSLVHPEHKRRGQFDSAIYETWNLGLWYLELSLLRICGYSVTYSNRLGSRWVGQVEDVPWKK